VATERKLFQVGDLSAVRHWRGRYDVFWYILIRQNRKARD